VLHDLNANALGRVRTAAARFVHRRARMPRHGQLRRPRLPARDSAPDL
jgi:hypothetical protein